MGGPTGIWAGAPVLPSPYAAARWTWLLIAYIGYALTTFVGSLIGTSLQVAGASVFLLVIAVRYGHLLLPLRKNLLTLALLACFLLPLFAPLLGVATIDENTVGYLIKYYAVFFLLLICLPLRLPPLFTSKLRVPLFAVLMLLLAWAFLFHPITADDSDRVKGVFSNPNNYALMAMGLLFLLDEARDSWTVRWVVTALAGGLILLSGTAGAMISFLVAICYRLVVAGKGRLLLIVLVSVLCTVGLAIATVLMLRDQPMIQSGPLGKLVAKVEIARDNLTLVFSDKSIDFVAASQGYSVTDTSALWRLIHWKNTLETYWQGGWLRILFGNGLGSSNTIMGILPHNDYLRFLFELGVFGCVAILLVWGSLFRQLQPSSRWLMVMIAVYSFSENIFDNYLAMALFVFFSVSARHPIYVLGRQTLEGYQRWAVRCLERVNNSYSGAVHGGAFSRTGISLSSRESAR